VELSERLRGRVNEPPFTDGEQLTREVTNIDPHRPIQPLVPGQEHLPAIGEEGTPARMELMYGALRNESQFVRDINRVPAEEGTPPSSAGLEVKRTKPC